MGMGGEKVDRFSLCLMWPYFSYLFLEGGCVHFSYPIFCFVLKMLCCSFIFLFIEKMLCARRSFQHFFCFPTQISDSRIVLNYSLSHTNETGLEAILSDVHKRKMDVGLHGWVSTPVQPVMYQGTLFTERALCFKSIFFFSIE